MPFDVAFSLDETEALAYGIIFGQFEGGEFDWNDMKWKKNEKS